MEHRLIRQKIIFVLEIKNGVPLFFLLDFKEHNYTAYDFERNCSWAQFRNISTGTTFYVFNSHYTVNPDKGVAMICERAKQIAQDKPIYILGDFSYERNISYNRILSEGFADGKYISLDTTLTGTYNKWGSYYINTRIPTDYCFVSPETVCIKKYFVDTKLYDGCFGSDHFPLLFYSVIKNTAIDEIKPKANNQELSLTDTETLSLASGMTAEKLSKCFENSGRIVIVDADGLTLEADKYVGTGCFVQLVFGDEIFHEVQVVADSDIELIRTLLSIN